MDIDITTVLAESQLFQGLAAGDYKRLTSIANTVVVKKGDTVLVEGEPATGFYVVAKGLVKVFKVSPDGKEQVFHIFGEGEPVGEVPVFSGTKYPAHAVALARTVLIYFRRADFVGAINQHPQLALNMLATLSQRLRKFAGVIEALSLQDVSARLANYLLVLSREQQSRCIVLPMSKGDLASSLGTISETLSRTFSRLRAAGILEIDRDRIEILDAETLALISERGRILQP